MHPEWVTQTVLEVENPEVHKSPYYQTEEAKYAEKVKWAAGISAQEQDGQ